MYSDRNRSRYGSYSYGYDNSNRTTVPLPPNMSAGIIIGKGGSNIKMLQSRSGARVSVNATTNCVDISGSAAAVSEAARMVRQQIKAFQATGGAYPIPQRVHSLLEPCFGSSEHNLVGFKDRHDEVASATGRRERLFVLAPSGSDPSGGGGSSTDGLTGMLSGLSLAGASQGAGRGTSSPHGGEPPLFLLPSQQPLLLEAAATAAQKAVCHTPRFDDIKIRFNFGKCFFYKGPSTYTKWTLQQLQSKSVPDDMKSVFSTAVTGTARDTLQASTQSRLDWLLTQGFRHVEDKSGVSLHINHQATNAGYTLSFTNKSGSLVLRKFKSGNTKLAFGNLLCGPESPDWRFEMLAQYHFNADPATKDLLNSLAASACLNRTGAVSMPGLAAADMVKDSERHKDKGIYVGSWPGTAAGSGGYGGGSSGGSSGSSSTEIKVTLSKVYDALTEQHTYEVAGTSPQINTLLLQQLRSGSLSSTAEQSLLRHLGNVVAFARAAVASMASNC